MNHTLSINNNSFIKTSLSYSRTSIDEDVYESTITETDDGVGGVLIGTSDEY